MNIFKFLEGKKTIICGVLLFLVAGSEGMGYISKQEAEIIRSVILGGGLIALRLAIK